MDFVAVIIISVLVGTANIYRSRNSDKVQIYTNGTEAVQTVSVNEIPVRGNLQLLQEQDAFTRILKELGLK